MDRVTQVTRGWLWERASRSHKYDYGAGEISFGPDTQSWLTDVVVRGFEAAVHDVVAPGGAKIVIETVMLDAPHDADVQVTPEVALPQAVVDYLAPQFGELADQGLHVDMTHLTRALSERIAAAVETDFQIGQSRLPLAMLVGSPPGVPLTPPRGDNDDDDDDDDSALTGR